MGRQPCCDKVGLKRGPWTIDEDHKLMNFILNNGIQCWRMVPKLAGLLRCGKSCRLRWINYLRPDLKRGALSESEENQIIQLHARLGNRWSKIASHFPGRTDNEIKNHWNTRIKKRIKFNGLDPLTHLPVEQEEKIEDKIETIPESNLQKEEENETLDVTATVNNKAKRDDPEMDEKEKEVNTNSDETNELLKNYEMLCGSLDVDLWIDQEDNTFNTCSPSFSREDSLNPSIGESSTAKEDSLQQWGFDSVYSMLSWDGFNALEQELFLMENSQ
ncbi:unnamed protein product [Ilex paraguariensis]|uniref:Uncharacterized protein n=1 Tax=Ilex paraguariensis TaxID=185542 RepID=A0ABC8TBK8_9AQUA